MSHGVLEYWNVGILGKWVEGKGKDMILRYIIHFQYVSDFRGFD